MGHDSVTTLGRKRNQLLIQTTWISKTQVKKGSIKRLYAKDSILWHSGKSKTAVTGAGELLPGVRDAWRGDSGNFCGKLALFQVLTRMFITLT